MGIPWCVHGLAQESEENCSRGGRRRKEPRFFEPREKESDLGTKYKKDEDEENEKEENKNKDEKRRRRRKKKSLVPGGKKDPFFLSPRYFLAPFPPVWSSDSAAEPVGE